MTGRDAADAPSAGSVSAPGACVADVQKVAQNTGGVDIHQSSAYGSASQLKAGVVSLAEARKALVG